MFGAPRAKGPPNCYPSSDLFLKRAPYPAKVLGEVSAIPLQGMGELFAYLLFLLGRKGLIHRRAEISARTP